MSGGDIHFSCRTLFSVGLLWVTAIAASRVPPHSPFMLELKPKNCPNFRPKRSTTVARNPLNVLLPIPLNVTTNKLHHIYQCQVIDLLSRQLQGNPINSLDFKNLNFFLFHFDRCLSDTTYTHILTIMAAQYGNIVLYLKYSNISRLTSHPHD